MLGLGKLRGIALLVIVLLQVPILLAKPEPGTFRPLDSEVEAALRKRRAERRERFNAGAESGRAEGLFAAHGDVAPYDPDLGTRRFQPREGVRIPPRVAVAPPTEAVVEPGVELAPDPGVAIAADPEAVVVSPPVEPVPTKPPPPGDIAVASREDPAPIADMPQPVDVQTAAERKGDDLGSVADGEAALEGILRQPDGTAVAGIEVRLRPLFRDEVVAETATDEGGNYRFPRVASGRYKLDFGPSSTPTGYAPDRLRLEPGENRYDFRTPRLGALEVEAFAADGARLLEGARIEVKGPYGRKWQGTTDAQGKAGFRHLPVGNYRVLLFQDQVRVDQEQRAILAQVTSAVTLQALGES